MNYFKLFCIVIGLFLLSSCSQATPVPPTATSLPPTATPTPIPSITNTDIMGTWLVGGAYCQFDEDGAYRCAFSKQALGSEPFDVGNYELDGEHLLLIQTAGDCLDIPGEYALELMNDGAELQVLTVDDPCESRPLEKYSPFIRQDE